MEKDYGYLTDKGNPNITDDYERVYKSNKNSEQKSNISENYTVQKEKPYHQENTDKNFYGKPKTQHKQNYFIHFPFYTSKEFYNSIEDFRNGLRDLDPKYDNFFYQQRFHITLTTLFKLDDDQMQKVVSIINDNADSLKEICVSRNKKFVQKVATSKIDYFGQKQQKPKNYDKKEMVKIGYVSQDTKCSDFDLIQQCVDKLIRSLLKNTDFLTEKRLNVVFNEQTGRYEIETPHITVLASPKYKQNRKAFDISPVLQNFGNHDFGYVYFDTLMFSKMDGVYTPMIKIPQ